METQAPALERFDSIDQMHVAAQAMREKRIAQAADVLKTKLVAFLAEKPLAKESMVPGYDNFVNRYLEGKEDDFVALVRLMKEAKISLSVEEEEQSFWTHILCCTPATKGLHLSW